MQSLPRALGAAMHIRVVLASATSCLAAGGAWASGPMVTGGLTSQPIGHYEFCKANPADCSIRPRDTGPEHMTGAVWSLIVGVNTSVNEAVKPMNDIDIYGKDEVWAY